MKKITLVSGTQDAQIEKLKSLLPDSFARLADAYLARDERQKAKEILEEYANDFPGYPTGYWLLGKTYYSLDQKEQALDYLHKTLQMIPEHPAALELIGKIYMESGDHALARSYLAQVRQIDRLGDLKFEETEDKLSEDIKEEKTPQRISRNKENRVAGRFATETMVNLYLKQGHKELARELCRDILVSQPDNNRIRTILEELEN